MLSLITTVILAPLQSRQISGVNKRIREHSTCRDYSKRTSHFLTVSSCAPPPLPLLLWPKKRERSWKWAWDLSFLLQGGKEVSAVAEEDEPCGSVWRPCRLFMAPGTMQATSLTLSIKLSDLLLQWLQSGTMKGNGELCARISALDKQGGCKWDW